MLDQRVVEVVCHPPQEEQADDEDDRKRQSPCWPRRFAHSGAPANGAVQLVLIFNAFLSPTPRRLTAAKAHEKPLHLRKLDHARGRSIVLLSPRDAKKRAVNGSVGKCRKTNRAIAPQRSKRVSTFSSCSPPKPSR